MTTAVFRVLDPRDLIRSVILWASLIPIALLAFLGGELTEIDLVDMVNAVVYAFGGLLAIALARQSALSAEADRPAAANPLGSFFWLVAAGFCAVFVLSELGGDIIEQYETKLSPAWLGDLLCWLAAGIFILMVARSRLHQGRSAGVATPTLGLLTAGFVLQGIFISLDVGEVGFPRLLGTDPQTYENISDLAEFAFLQLYLLGFIGVAAELSARHALRVQIAKAESIEDPAACLRAAQLAFITAAFSSARFSRRRLFRAATGLFAAGGLGGMVNGIKITRKLGPSIKRRTGKSLLRQFTTQMRLMLRYGLAPKTYYLFEFFDPACERVASQYLQRNETKAAAYKIMHRHTGHRLSEKLVFHNRCRDLGLPVAPVVFAATGGAPAPQFADTQELPGTDL
ncbi:MAG: hypothetical protein J0626_12295, partial [Rhodospirillaceae bacterium]|nr:hypothetical protein [Rhodospirillaceae bacterium]